MNNLSIIGGQFLAEKSHLKEAQFYLEQSLSENTRLLHSNCMKHFRDWGGLLPCSVSMLIRYVIDCAKEYKISSIDARLKTIRRWHKLNKRKDPTADEQFLQVYRGIQRSKAQTKKRASPILYKHIIVIDAGLKERGHPLDIRNNALIQIGFHGAFRRSELTAITFADLAFTEQGVEIFIPSSKTDQLKEGTTCCIPYSKKAPCAVTALKEWLKFLEIKGITSGPIFRGFEHDLQTVSNNAISDRYVGNIVKNVVKDFEIGDSSTFSGHSLRRGFATSATHAGAPLHAIKKQGRWRSAETVMGYIDESDGFICNASDLINSAE